MLTRDVAPTNETKSAEEVALLRSAGQAAAKILARLGQACRAGTTTQAISDIAEVTIRQQQCQPLFRGVPSPKKKVRPFPAVLCISVNEEIVHGVPGPRKLKAGDIVSLDCGVRRLGYCGDSAWTFAVGGQDALTPERRRLMEVALATLELGISQCRPGVKWSAIAAQMQHYVEDNGFGVVREFVGHGIGKELHEKPQVPNYADEDTRNESDFTLEPGMVFCIEPMVTLGRGETKILRDGWTVVTKDKHPSAHYEHMVAITQSGADVLTRIDELSGPF